MKTKFSLLALFIAAIFFISCGSGHNHEEHAKKHDETHSEKKEEVKHEKHKDCDGVHWSHHEGHGGPGEWKNLCDKFSTCGGEVQSPINIVTESAENTGDMSAIQFNYGKSNVNIINNEHTVQFNVTGENSFTVNDKEYKLLQFHYHAKSEHTINGEYFPIEVHFVHKHSDDDYAVIGAMFTEGAENELLKSYLDKFPTTKGEYTSEDMIDLYNLLPKNKSYFYYGGSLTTPPCSEIVNWYVLKEPIEASKEQIEKFAEILNNNYRPVQELNDRVIKEYNE